MYLLIKRLLNNEILVKSLMTMFVQGLGQMSAFISAILLARFLSVDQYGLYMFGITAATICAVIATLGADGILARHWGWSQKTGFARTQSTFLLHNWFWRRGISLLVMTFIIVLLYHLYFSSSEIHYVELLAFFFALPFFSANLLQSFYVANRKVVYANLIQLFMRIIMLLCVLMFFYFGIQKPSELVALMLILTSSYMFMLWLKITARYGIKTQKPQGSNIAFMLLKWGNLLLSQIDIVLLKIFSSSANIAYYAVALQLSALVVFVLNAVSANIMSQVANDYKNLNPQQFQYQITGYTRIIYSLSTLGMIFLIACGYWITKLYGEAYYHAYFLFCILMIGQAVNVLCGSVFTILNMSGHEKLTCRIFYIALLINIVLGIAFIPFWQAYGVAIASAIAMIFWNVTLVIIVIKKLGVNPTIFARRQLTATSNL